MRIPIRLLIADDNDFVGTFNWEEILQNWEAYEVGWDVAGTEANEPFLSMFDDEGVSLKQVMKDANDLNQLFTDYTRSFNVPASKHNNRLFKHYYNIDIDNGFDARQLVSAAILMNNEIYKVGNIALESVKMSNGVPTSYTLRFYGKLSDIRKSIGQDKLTDLPLITLTSFDKKVKFTNTAKNDIVFPLSSRFNRFKWGSTINDYDNDAKTKAINYISSTRNEGNYGIEPNDILGAAKVGWLLDQIETKYNLTFAGALTQNYVRELYLWLTNQEESSSEFSAFASNLSPTTSSFTGVFISGGSITYAYVSPTNYYNVKAKATWTGNGTLTIYKNGAPVASTSTSGSNTPDVLIDYYSTVTFKLELESSQTTSLTVTNTNSASSLETFTESVAINSTADYSVRANMPQLSILDFLGALFKMFNIVATVDDNLVMTTYHYDSFMATGVTRDITKYVQSSSYSVDAPSSYSGVNFSHVYSGTAVDEGYKTTASREYGSLIYDQQSQSGNRLNGVPYKFESGVNVLPIEHITDGTTLTNVLHTYFGDVSLNEKQVKAAFTYVQPSALVGVAWDNGSTVNSISSYLMPTNLYDPLHSYTTTSFLNGLYWGDELRDYNPSTNVVGLGLYSCFYRGIVNSLFDESKRLVTLDAYLPQSVIRRLTLADILVISDRYYNISEIETNYLDGKSSIKLIQIGQSSLPQWSIRTATSVTNSTGATVYYSYINSSGYLTSSSVVNGGVATFDCIGDILRVSNSSLTFTYA